MFLLNLTWRHFNGKLTPVVVSVHNVEHSECIYHISRSHFLCPHKAPDIRDMSGCVGVVCIISISPPHITDRGYNRTYNGTPDMGVWSVASTSVNTSPGCHHVTIILLPPDLLQWCTRNCCRFSAHQT